MKRFISAGAAVRAPEGDFRPWDEIRAWASEIVSVLAAREPASAH